MYLKSVKVENYRKFREENNILTLAYDKNEQEEQSKLNVAKNTTLVVGKNNGGKTTIIELLHKLSSCSSGMKPFKVHDFNLDYLKEIYQSILINEEPFILPKIKFQLSIGVDDEKMNSLSAFENVLILNNFEKYLTEANHHFDFKIDIEYHCNDTEQLREKFNEIKQMFEMPIKQEYLANLEEDMREKIQTKSLKECLASTDDEVKKNNVIVYLNRELFNQFLNSISEASYRVDFYPEGNDEAAENFSLANILDIKMIRANNISQMNCLSDAYNKIIKSFISSAKGEEKEALDTLLINMNFNTKDIVDRQYTKRLNDVIQEIESSKHLSMNLMPYITMEKILQSAVSYEYLENENYIPENQFGLGYTHLMMIIAELVEYIDQYKYEQYTDKITIICIEEPENYMHPQMQELFIDNIEEAINKLYEGRKEAELIEKLNYQLIISTHSPHILNSKIHSGNTFDNINYLTTINYKESSVLTAKIVPLSDDKIIQIEDKPKLKREDKSLKNSLTYIKKHMRIETSTVLFSDAVIVVEGPTEEAYLKYLLKENKVLKNFYVTVLNINGAYGKVYFNLLQLLGIPTVLFTDMDYKRKKVEKKADEESDGEMSTSDKILYQFPQITHWLDENIVDSIFTTNSTLKDVLAKVMSEEHIQICNQDESQWAYMFQKYQKNNDSSAYFQIDLGSISILTQGQIQGSYATSLEEAIILTNSDSKYLCQVLATIVPKIYEDTKQDNKDTKEVEGFYKANLAIYAFYFQKKLKGKKTAFMNQIIYDQLIGISDDAPIQVPQYLQEGFKLLEYKLTGIKGEQR